MKDCSNNMFVPPVNGVPFSGNCEDPVTARFVTIKPIQFYHDPKFER